MHLPRTTRQHYANLLRWNAGMAAGFTALYFAGYGLRSMGLLLLSLLFACVCFLVELTLGVIAAANRRWLLAALYASLSFALFYADRWLLEQAE